MYIRGVLMLQKCVWQDVMLVNMFKGSSHPENQLTYLCTLASDDNCHSGQQLDIKLRIAPDVRSWGSELGSKVNICAPCSEAGEGNWDFTLAGAESLISKWRTAPKIRRFGTKWRTAPKVTSWGNKWRDPSAFSSSCSKWRIGPAFSSRGRCE